MIAHGRKQISEMVYARKASEGGGAVRLTNMIRGGAVVFGGLKPSFNTPYSKAATAALKAAFPTQWAIIRDYGFNHPALVPFINANYLIAPYVCGCIEPDVQYPLGLAKSYLTEFQTKSNCSFRLISFIEPYTARFEPFIAGAWNASGGCYVELNSDTSFTVVRKTSFSTTNCANHANKNVVFDVTQSNVKINVNGSVATNTTSGTIENNNIRLYGSNRGSLWRCLQFYEAGVETHRLLALTDNYIWDYVTGTLIDNN